MRVPDDSTTPECVPRQASQIASDADLSGELPPYPDPLESPPAGTLDALLADLPLGWRVNTLCQNDQGVWFCNLTSGATYTRIAAASTPHEALATSLDRIDEAAPIRATTSAWTSAPKLDLSALVRAAAPAPPLKRRF